MSRLTASILLVLIYCLLSACATPYQPEGLTGGYSEMQLNQDTYQVAFKGNEFTSRNQVNQYLLIRAAELAQQHGYKYFLVLGANEQASVRHVTTPTTISGTTNSSYSGTGYASGRNYQWSGYSNSYTNAVVKPGQTSTRTRHENSIIIRMLKKLMSNQQALDAEIILGGINKTPSIN